MAQLFITKKDFRSLVEGLIKERAVYAPVMKHGSPAFERVEDFASIRLSKSPTRISAKGFFFPPEETLVRFDMEKNSASPVIEAPAQALIGLHPCDIRAVKLMDEVFAYSTRDENYLKRRENTLIIGTDCVPDDYCFCKSLGTESADSGFDLFLDELKSGFIVKTGSSAGKKLLKRFCRARAPKTAELKEAEAAGKKRLSAFTNRLEAEPSSLPLVYAGADEHPVWEEIGARCYGCGSCNTVCPTCYCFDVKDDVSLDLKKADRIRSWDACTLEDFAKVAGGHNFRKSRADRLRHRFNRKFHYLTGRFKSLFCVGCGRCSRTCLVKINISEVTNVLICSAKQKLAVPSDGVKG